LPVALFFAVCWALNRVHRDNEIVVAQASGMSNRSVAAPLMRLAVMAALLHLVLNLWVQPAGYREMRQTMANAQTDLASTLVKAGAFTTPEGGLTTYSRVVNGNQLTDLLVSDSRDPKKITTYIAKQGVIVTQEGKPIIVMSDGYIQTKNDRGSLDLLKFAQSNFELATFVDDQKAVILKDSDRYLPELFFPDLTNYNDRKNQRSYLAEGHARISGPLLDIAMVLIAVYAVLGGDFSRRGYSKRISIATAVALMLRLLAFSAQSIANKSPDLNWLQYAVPLLAIAVVAFMFFVKPALTRRKRRRRRPPTGVTFGAAAG
jgi:lipopolysaccharide export system permease protein